MKRILWAALATLGLAALPAQAQVTNTTQPFIGPRPAVSPFLNLRPTNTGLDFFLRVRPDQQTFNTLQQLQQEITLGQTAPVTADAATSTALTGHAARFGNYSHYYAGVNQAPLTTPPLNIRQNLVPQLSPGLQRRGF